MCDMITRELTSQSRKDSQFIKMNECMNAPSAFSDKVVPSGNFFPFIGVRLLEESRKRCSKQVH